MTDDDPIALCWHTEPNTPCDWDVCRQPERLAAGDRGPDPRQGRECAVSLSGSCLREIQSETACDTGAGECVHAGRPAEHIDNCPGCIAFTPRGHILEKGTS